MIKKSCYRISARSSLVAKPPLNLSLCRSFLTNREVAIDYLNTCDRVYVVDGFVNWDPEVGGEGACVNPKFWKESGITWI
jgi:hypothetical protein